MHHPNLLFDLDGTLTDSRLGITRAIQVALRAEGIDEPDLRALEVFIGPPLLQSFMAHYGFDEARAWRAVEAYRVYFRTTGLYENEVYAGIRELLAGLHAAGRRLYLVTAKPWVFAQEILRHFALTDYFTALYGSELDGTRGDKTELLRHVLATEALAPETCLMLGDREHDLIAARENGVAAVALGYGFGSREELERQRPAFHFHSVAALRQGFGL
ncbi:HAD family hydrolase [Pseudomonas oryzihabitans]|uniref:HAD-IA family hydrolase n=1 Tax=Pseudomonas rhizoryzae TaxID=2571129 RepID=UPI0007374457|nr:HAD-IA family hydrolase [Pseudomonas rhizoryzae]KTT31489.1 HAD family hydrolase [Pseudomonas psychrotolerans]KTT32009.1 HAD family hydrolase [Pseudomonas psychrotolerans]KTT38162.1 HAD family hydrolase [Pseudomonas psychrotolerans]KTT43170.1 HAD family hydrolase [Pseudomonas psychrotolerans]KTT75798.1 HAD family hydrolase [Pseudomonas psychrotolerans]